MTTEQPFVNGLETQALHAGYVPDPVTHARAVPIYQTTSYTFDSTDHAADLFGLRAFGNIYTRLMNPTTDVLEKRVAALEGGAAAVAVSSGHAAIAGTILTLAKAGDEIVASSDLYGGTINLFRHSLARLGITVRFVRPNDETAWREAINAKTRALFVESLGNPRLDIADLRPLADLAHAHNLPLVVDNTVPTPILLRPIEQGADIVIHSATKFIGGQGNSMGGVVVDAGQFDWAAADARFAEFSAPDPSYHGLRFTEAFGKLAFILRFRTLYLRDFGCSISPLNSWLLLQGLETLPLRIQRHSDNALAVAHFLEAHPAVSWVNYPGLASAPTASLKSQYLPQGQGAIVGFGVRGGKEAARRVIEHVKLFSHLANIGDSRSLIIHPATTTHSQLTDAEMADAGVTPDYIRLSVGLEAVDDLIADLRQAIETATREPVASFA